MRLTRRFPAGSHRVVGQFKFSLFLFLQRAFTHDRYWDRTAFETSPLCVPFMQGDCVRLSKEVASRL